MSLFSRARQGLTLSPTERTTLKLIKGVVYAVLAFLLGGQGLAIFNALQQPGANVGTILHDQLLTPVLMIVLLTAEKWFTAQGDKPLADVVAAVASDLPQPLPAAPSPILVQPTPTPVLPSMTVPIPAPVPPMGSGTLIVSMPPGTIVQSSTSSAPPTDTASAT